MSEREILSPRIKEIITELFKHITPDVEQFSVRGKEDVLLNDISRMLRAASGLTRFFILFAFRLFQYFPVFFGFKFKKFTELDFNAQQRYVDAWANSPVVTIGEIFKAIRSLLMIVVFNDKNFWNYIGYYPEEHMKARLALRERLMKESETKIETV